MSTVKVKKMNIVKINALTALLATSLATPAWRK